MTAAIPMRLVVGLEPSTNFPNARAFERSQGRVLKLDPGKSYETFLRIAVHDHLENVAALEAIAGSMTADRPATVHAKPQTGFSPV